MPGSSPGLSTSVSAANSDVGSFFALPGTMGRWAATRRPTGAIGDRDLTPGIANEFARIAEAHRGGAAPRSGRGQTDLSVRMFFLRRSPTRWHHHPWCSTTGVTSPTRHQWNPYRGAPPPQARHDRRTRIRRYPWRHRRAAALPPPGRPASSSPAGSAPGFRRRPGRLCWTVRSARFRSGCRPSSGVSRLGAWTVQAPLGQRPAPASRGVSGLRRLR